MRVLRRDHVGQGSALGQGYCLQLYLLILRDRFMPPQTESFSGLGTCTSPHNKFISHEFQNSRTSYHAAKIAYASEILMRYAQEH